ncbi:ribonuclease T2 family protein [Gluconobacter wancherniae]|mgnify:CR=1 FL=1|uniref:Ribonuclease n=1 Tax=Gluconobacter wancherniae NBRC 103581 TaxID=656744 RepID=A0A511AXH5_9PROT|nr:ribonuclease I [Gluconobacter wancherniae]MBF0853068.1 ribonuclease I [Gluconobacter wancherniae]MBS1061587.1 ribonuclease I [Gluconobacter wancherniae]MBS1087955.1 ribonuclease I [Gluconobacter wancherniae]MBS1093648.1 ribonuclease I [Gluconobacter wancherniae]GBD56214.1 ribonuclease I [Gluconobacter wancherniae NBRC 103581]
MKQYLIAAFLMIAGCATQAPTGPSITPLEHTDFTHDTLALTWQPGFCSSGGGCLADQPRHFSIGLHGLWASEPHTLEAQNVPVVQWWSKGCDLYELNDTPPVLRQATRDALAGVVPHLKKPLYVHEYTKHARCFGYDADSFFVTSMALRDRFASSGFGIWLTRQEGFQVRKDQFLSTFATMTGADAPRALQLRCETSANGQTVLSQLWFTLDPKKLSAFPAKESYLPSPHDQNGCPAVFLVPGWDQVSSGSAAVQRP